jgi:hypothetical protein
VTSHGGDPNALLPITASRLIRYQEEKITDVIQRMRESAQVAIDAIDAIDDEK